MYIRSSTTYLCGIFMNHFVSDYFSLGYDFCFCINVVCSMEKIVHSIYEF